MYGKGDFPFSITEHVRKRFVERSSKKYSKMNILPPEEAEALFDELCDEINERKSEIDQEIINRLHNAREDRSCLNDSNFMGRYYDKFGYDHRFQFLADKDFVYIIVFEGNVRKVVTCVRASTHKAGKLAFRPKFGRTK